MASMALEFYMAEVILRCYYGNVDNVHFLSSPGMMFRDLYENFHVRERLPFVKVRVTLLSFYSDPHFSFTESSIQVLGCLMPR